MATRLKLDQESLGLSMHVERQTGAHIKDCFGDEETIYFVVAQGQIGRAIGKGGVNIKRLQDELRKNVRMVEYRETATDYIRSIIYPLRVEEIKEELGPQGTIITLKDSNRKTKGLLIGREARNLQLLNRAVKRFFNVEIKVE